MPQSCKSRQQPLYETKNVSPSGIFEQNCNLWLWVFHTASNSRPPHGVPEVYVAISFEAVSLFCLVQSLNSLVLAPTYPLAMRFVIRSQAKCGRSGRDAGYGTFLVITKLVPVWWSVLEATVPERCLGAMQAYQLLNSTSWLAPDRYTCPHLHQYECSPLDRNPSPGCNGSAAALAYFSSNIHDILNQTSVTTAKDCAAQ